MAKNLRGSATPKGLRATLVLRGGRAEVRIADCLNEQTDYRVFSNIREAVQYIYDTVKGVEYE